MSPAKKKTKPSRTKQHPSGKATVAKALAALAEVTADEKRKPATDKQLDAIASVLGAVPADLRALYGFAANLGAVIGGGSLEWLGVADAVKCCRLNREHGAPERLFPIATDGAGNFACFDRDSGRVVDWDHETHKATALAPTLAGYLERTVVRELREGREHESAARKEKGKAPPVGKLPASTRRAAKLEAVANASIRRFPADGACFVDDAHVVLADQNATYVVDLTTQKETRVAAGAYGIAFDPTSEHLLLAKFGEMALAEARSGRVLARWKAPVGHWAGVAFAAGGGFALCYSTRPLIALWDVRGGEGIPQSGGKPELLPAYDLPEGKPVAVFGGHANWVHAARLSADGTTLASGDHDGKLCLWNASDRSLVGSASFAEPIVALDFALDGGSMFVGLESGQMLVVDRSGKTLRSFRAKEKVIDLRALANGLLLVLLWTSLTLVDPADGRIVAKIATAKGSHMARIADVRGDVVLLSRPAALFRVV